MIYAFFDTHTQFYRHFHPKELQKKIKNIFGQSDRLSPPSANALSGVAEKPVLTLFCGLKNLFFASIMEKERRACGALTVNSVSG